MVERDPAAELKPENSRLIALLEANDIQWRMQQPERSSPASLPAPSRLSTVQKSALFRRSFRRRTDGDFAMQLQSPDLDHDVIRHAPPPPKIAGCNVFIGFVRR